MDKLAHLGFYAVLGWLVARACGKWAPAALAGLMIGVLDEWIQSGTAGRSADPFDLAADVAGAALGAWLGLRAARMAGRS
jgi:VanZ family protein